MFKHRKENKGNDIVRNIQQGKEKYIYANEYSNKQRESIYIQKIFKQTNKQTPWPLVRERTIPTDRPPLVDEI
jgi:hypothetical protein